MHTEWVQGKEQWWPVDWDVTLIADSAFGANTRDYPLISAFPAIQLQTGASAVTDLEAELVYVGLGHPADLVGRDLTGKVAVVHGVLQPDPFSQSARGHIEAVIEAGAVGVLTMLDAPGNHQYALEDMGPADVPCFILGGDDGRFVEDLIAAAGAANPPTVRLSLNAEVRDSWRGKNVMGMIRGEIDEYVVIAAHRDILDKTPIVVNIEHPSTIWSYYRGELRFKNGTVPGQLIATTSQAPRGLTVSNGNPLLISFYHDAIDRYGLVIDSEVARLPTGDAFGFFLAGYPVAQILDANLWYHSTGDRLDAIHPDGLERATRLYAYVLDKIDSSSRAELTEKGR